MLCRAEHFCYDDAVILQALQCVIVESKEKINVVFISCMEAEAKATDFGIIKRLREMLLHYSI